MVFSGSSNSFHCQTSMHPSQAPQHTSFQRSRPLPIPSFETNPTSSMMYGHQGAAKMDRNSMDGLRQKLREAAGFPNHEQHPSRTNSMRNALNPMVGSSHYGNGTAGGRVGPRSSNGIRNSSNNELGFGASHRSSAYYGRDGTSTSRGTHQPRQPFLYQSHQQPSPMPSMMHQALPAYGFMIPIECGMGTGVYEPCSGGFISYLPQQQQPFYPPYNDSFIEPTTMGMGMTEPYSSLYPPMQPPIYTQQATMAYRNPMRMMPEPPMFAGGGGAMLYGSSGMDLHPPTYYHGMDSFGNMLSPGFW